MMRFVSALLLSSCFLGCGSDAVPPGGTPDAANTVDAPVTPDGWTELVARDWTIPAGSLDVYRCKRIQVTQDMWVAGFRAIAPLGTHHTVVTISNGGTTGDYDCNAGSLDQQMLYASGVGTEELAFPDGVAMQIKAGQFINLNLHLFNAQDGELLGTSGILIKNIEAAAVQHEADMTFAGSLNFSIPPGDNQVINGGCTTPAEWHIFTLWPHMHTYAKHQKVEVTLPGAPAPTVLLDDAYSFYEQTNYPMAEMLLPQGSVIKVTCLYNNDTNPARNIGFGDSSGDEMCFTGMYKWPAGGNLFQCSGF